MTDPREKVTRGSSERNAFGPSGIANPEGTGPLKDGFLDATDIKGLPWVRKRGEEWTTTEFRGYVKEWLDPWLKAKGIRTWQITERANAARMSNFRLPEDQYYLIIAVTKKLPKGRELRAETAIAFSRVDRDRENTRKRLDLAAQALEASLTA